MREDLVVGLDALGDRQGVVAGLGQLAEQRPHLLGRLDVVARAVEAEAVGVVLVATHADAQQVVVAVGLVGRDVVRVIGRQQRDVQLPGDVEQATADAQLDVEAVIHQLTEVVLTAEDVLVLTRRPEGLLELAETKARLHLTGRAAGGRDDALGVPADDLAIHAGLHVVALEGGQRAQPEEVVQAGGVLGQHRHVGVATTAGDILAALHRGVAPVATARRPVLLHPREARGRRDIGLDADDRLHGALGILEALRELVELVGAEHVAVVGHRDGRHALTADLGEQLGVLRGAVEHRVLGVGVQVDEGIDHGVWRPLSGGADLSRVRFDPSRQSTPPR